MVTAANDARTVDSLLKLGVVDYLVKPFTMERFQQGLDTFCLHREAVAGDQVSQDRLDRIFAPAAPAADRGILEGMAPAFGMKLLPVSPADAGKTVAQLLGEVEMKASRTLVLEPGAYPPALVLANFKEKDLDTLLDLMKQAQVNIPLKAVVTPSNKNWVFGDLLAHLSEEHAAFTAAAKEQA